MTQELFDTTQAKVPEWFEGLRHRVSEVKKQFFGSDSSSGYTFVYVWLANQFGHFMIGFAGTFLCMWIVSFIWPFVLHPQTLGQGVVVAAVGVGWLLLWMAKEFLSDVAKGEQLLRVARTRRKQRKGDTSEDSVDRADVRFTSDLNNDSWTDTWFYFSGVLTALMALYGPGLADWLDRQYLAGALPFATFFFFLFASIRPSKKWLRRYNAFDKAKLPSVVRFAIDGRLPDRQSRKAAVDFIFDGKPGHLIIIGPPKSGRTTCAVALGVEALVERPLSHPVVYRTLTKLLDTLVDKNKFPGSIWPPRPVWSPEDATLLIIDDVGAITPMGTSLLTADDFKNLLAALLKALRTRKEKLLTTLEQRQIIWVVGDEPENAEDWKGALEDAFGTGTCVGVIKLVDALRPDDRGNPVRVARKQLELEVQLEGAAEAA